jgi:hypothetical protein
MATWLKRLDPWLVIRFALHRRVRLTVIWLIALASTASLLHRAWHRFNEPKRRDGNDGHASVDFGGQWLSARMLVEGEGRHLYDRRHILPVAQRAYPDDDNIPGERSDADKMVYDYFISADEPAPDGSLLCGALYPPTHSLLFAPLALAPPRRAYHIMQTVNVLLIWVVGLLFECLSQRRVWAPVTVLVLIFFPGCSAAVDLGQNPIVSLALLVGGWTLLRGGRPTLGGVCWGFLAFKPVWAAAFFLVPLLTRRWRFGAAMVLTGVCLAAATLPFVGWGAWVDWYRIGRLANGVYARDRNWIPLSRDLQGLPRRLLLEFDVPPNTLRPVYPHGQALPNVLALELLFLPVLITLMVVWWQRRRPVPLEGPGAAFVLLGAWLSCLHFMYYDVLLAALPVGLLFTEPAQFLHVRFLRRRDEVMSPEAEAYYRPRRPDELPPPMPLLPEGRRPRWVCNPLPPLVLLLLLILPGLSMRYDPRGFGQPIDTLMLVGLWAWCGWRWLAGEQTLDFLPWAKDGGGAGP